jgi:hypothetical protein
MKRCPECKKMVADSEIICPTFACTHVFAYDHNAQLAQVARIHATYPKGTVQPTDI